MGWISEQVKELNRDDLNLVGRQIGLLEIETASERKLRKEILQTIVPPGKSEDEAVALICETLLLPYTDDPDENLKIARWQLWHEVQRAAEVGDSEKIKDLPRVISEIVPTFMQRILENKKHKQAMSAHAFRAGIQRPEAIPFYIGAKVLSGLWNKYKEGQLKKEVVNPLIVFHQLNGAAAIYGDIPEPAFGPVLQQVIDLKLLVSCHSDTEYKWYFFGEIPDDAVRVVDRNWGYQPDPNDILVDCRGSYEHDRDYTGFFLTLDSLMWISNGTPRLVAIEDTDFEIVKPSGWFNSLIGEKELWISGYPFPYIQVYNDDDRILDQFMAIVNKVLDPS